MSVLSGRRTSLRVMLVFIVVGAMVLAVLPANAAPKLDRTRSYEIEVLSSPADLVSGGDARLSVKVPPGNIDRSHIYVNGEDVTGNFSVVPGTSNLEGVVDGLAVGENSVEVMPNERARGAASSLTLTNYPISGPMLVVDDEKTYAVRVYYRRNVHSPMFFPGKEGYLLFADANTSEPQIVGEPGSRPPVRWLPQSDYPRGRGDEVRELSSEAFGLDKGIGYTRAEQPVWTNWLPIRIRAMVKACDILFVAGAPDVLDPKDPFASFEGRAGAQVVAVSADDGAKLSATQLGSPPVFDGMIAADGRLFAALRDGSVVCLDEQEN